MSIDVVDLRNFYAMHLGVVARRLIGRGIRRRFADTRGMSVVGVGYPTPYLGLFREEAERCLAFMPAAQGVVEWPPDRPGVWARTDTTPFAHGRPYSRSQITQLLREAWFTPTGWGEALHVPPVARGWFLRSATAWERVGPTIAAPFAGVHIVEATKQVYRAVPARRTGLVPALEPALAPWPRGA